MSEIGKMLSRAWWVVLLRSILALILALYVFSRPEWTIILIVQVMGAFFLIDGILMVVHAITGHTGGSRMWTFLGGIFYIIAACVIFGSPFASAIFTQTLVIYIAAIMALLNGITKIITSIQLWNVIKRKWAVLADGIVSVVFAFILFKAPIMSGIVLMRIAGIFAVILAVSSIIFTFMLRKMK